MALKSFFFSVKRVQLAQLDGFLAKSLVCALELVQLSFKVNCKIYRNSQNIFRLFNISLTCSTCPATASTSTHGRFAASASPSSSRTGNVYKSLASKSPQRQKQRQRLSQIVISIVNSRGRGMQCPLSFSPCHMQLILCFACNKF